MIVKKLNIINLVFSFPLMETLISSPDYLGANEYFHVYKLE